MAGKSTVLRSVCAVALLAACGLHAPAARATVPYIDAFMLRNFSADSPTDRKSSFAVEMDEMRCVLLTFIFEGASDSLRLVQVVPSKGKSCIGAMVSGALHGCQLVVM